jgi:hypothetical protein
VIGVDDECVWWRLERRMVRGRGSIACADGVKQGKKSRLLGGRADWHGGQPKATIKKQ